jgi:Mg/Co/Ni transporter MgtE
MVFKIIQASKIFIICFFVSVAIHSNAICMEEKDPENFEYVEKTKQYIKNLDYMNKALKKDVLDKFNDGTISGTEEELKELKVNFEQLEKAIQEEFKSIFDQNFREKIKALLKIKEDFLGKKITAEFGEKMVTFDKNFMRFGEIKSMVEKKLNEMNEIQ